MRNRFAGKDLRLRKPLSAIHFLLGFYNHSLKRHDRALHWFEESKKVNPEGYLNRFFLAFTLLHFSRTEESLREAEKLAEDFPEKSRPLYLISSAYEMMHRCQDAILFLDKASLLSNSKEIRIFKLVLLLKLGRVEGAKHLAKEHRIRFNKSRIFYLKREGFSPCIA